VKAIAQTILKNKISPTFYGLMMADWQSRVKCIFIDREAPQNQTTEIETVTAEIQGGFPLPQRRHTFPENPPAKFLASPLDLLYRGGKNILHPISHLAGRSCVPMHLGKNDSSRHFVRRHSRMSIDRRGRLCPLKNRQANKAILSK
jgi:hypothetical protein